MAILREGPWAIMQTGLPCSGYKYQTYAMTLIGDQHEYELEAVAGDGSTLDLTGYSVSGAVYNASTGSVVLASETVTVAFASGGRLVWKPSIAWASAGIYRFSVSLTAAGETIILGGFMIEVSPR